LEGIADVARRAEWRARVKVIARQVSAPIDHSVHDGVTKSRVTRTFVCDHLPASANIEPFSRDDLL
jgi:hypothetical protein